MRKLLLMFAIAAVPMLLHARIGEDLKQCQARYGKPIKEDLKKDISSKYAIFRKDAGDEAIFIKVAFSAETGKAYAVIYAKVDVVVFRNDSRMFENDKLSFNKIFSDDSTSSCKKFSKDEKEIFLKANYAGEWKEKAEGSEQKYLWQTGDNKMFAAQLGENYNLFIIATDELLNLNKKATKKAMSGF